METLLARDAVWGNYVGWEVWRTRKRGDGCPNGELPNDAECAPSADILRCSEM